MASTTRDAILAAPRVSVVKGLGRPASEAEIAEYLDPWTDPPGRPILAGSRGRCRPSLHHGDAAGIAQQSKTPKLLVWGEDDGFQTVDYAKRYEREIRKTRLVRIKSAGHINPNAVAGALAEFFAAER